MSDLVLYDTAMTLVQLGGCALIVVGFVSQVCADFREKKRKADAEALTSPNESGLGIPIDVGDEVDSDVSLSNVVSEPQHKCGPLAGETEQLLAS